MRHLCLPALFVLTSVTAQQPAARAFLLDDYKNVVFADLKALRDRGIWADLEVSVLKVVFQQMEKEIGFPLASLDRMTMVADPGPKQEGGEMDPRNIREVLVFEGNGELPLGEKYRDPRSWQQATVGKHTVRRRNSMRPETVVQPCPEMQVRGATDVVEAALDGKPHAGQPCADLMSLLSGRGDNLAYTALDVGNPLLRTKALDPLFPGAEWPEDDAPAFLFCRVRATGDADDPHIEVEAVLRHLKEGAGLEASSKAVDAWLERSKNDPAMRAARPLLQRAEKKIDRTDLVIRADLGRTREAVGHMATLIMPLLAPRSVRAEVAAEVVPAAPVPEPKKEPEPKK
ncbi:MAG TPA: hypothetical protein VF384_19130 [Planctomycetota bacterium]